MLAVHDAIEVVALYAVEAAAIVDVVPVSVVGVDRVAAGADVDVVAARTGENPGITGAALQQVGGAAAVQRVVAGPTAQRVGVVGASKGVIAATPVLGVTAIAIPAVNASIAPPPRTTKPASSCSLPSRRLLQAYFLAITFPGGTLVSG